MLKEGELVTSIIGTLGAARYVMVRGRSIRGQHPSLGEVWVIDDGVNSPVLLAEGEGIYWRRGHVDVSDLVAAALLADSAHA